jgi:hypothetical protein
MFYTAASLGATAWTWVDAQGRRHFSDRPVPGAEQIELAGAQGFSRPSVSTPRPAAATPAAQAQTPAGRPYSVFNVVAPSQQQTLWNIEGTLNVQVELEPSLQAGHRLDVFLDGQRVAINATSNQFTVPEVFRGLHTMQAVVVDTNGTEVLRSLAVTFMVQQTSLLNPNNPNNAN